MEKKKPIAILPYLRGLALSCYQGTSAELVNAIAPFCVENSIFIEMLEPEPGEKSPSFIFFYLEPINQNEKIEDIERRLQEFVAASPSLDGWTICDRSKLSREKET